MSHVSSSPEQLLRALSSRLRLDYQAQDWGIVNADGGRLNEFVEHLVTQRLAPAQEFELAGLIMASANERLLAGLPVDLPSLVELVERYPEAFTVHVDYWKNLPPSDDFPLTRALRAVG